MKRTLPTILLFLGIAMVGGRPLAGQVPQAGPFATPVTLDTLDPAAFAQWVDGAEQPMPQKDGPRHVVWTAQTALEWDGVRFSDSKTPGPRHLRIGLKTPLPVGSVLVRAGGQVSLLQPEAPLSGRHGRSVPMDCGPAHREGRRSPRTKGPAKSMSFGSFPR